MIIKSEHLVSTCDEAIYVGSHETLLRKLHMTSLLPVNKSLWPISLLTLLIALLALALGMSVPYILDILSCLLTFSIHASAAGTNL